MSAAGKREELEAAIRLLADPALGRHAVAGILGYASAYAEAVAEERVNRLTPDELAARLRLAEASKERRRS